MSLPYDICVALRNAGFPQKGNVWYQMKNTGKLRVVNSPNTGNADSNDEHDWYIIPTLEGLIEACEKTEGYDQFTLEHPEMGWFATMRNIAESEPLEDEYYSGDYQTTPSIAVASLYLAITK